MNKSEHSRLFFFLPIFIALYLLVIARLFYWQVVKAEDLHDSGREQSTESLVSTASRGDILFSDEFPLATNKISYLLYANPKKVDSETRYGRLLSPILESEEASISALLDQDLFWVRLRSGLPFDKKEEIEKLKLDALGFQSESTRFYPEASMAAHLVGFVGKNELGEDEGYFGLEGFYDRQLRGRAGRIYMVKDALGNPILTDVREEKKIDGRSLVLSIDRSVQYAADRQLKRGIEKYQAEGGTVIVMDTKTGKLLASASYPKFDPQKYYEYEGSLYKNPAVSSLYEPGSTFKVLIMAAGIDAGLVKPDTKCDICSKPVEITSYKIKTWNDEYYPNTTMTEVIQHSDNTGMVFVGQKLGVKKLSEYLSRFGMGDITGIDVQGEISGELRDEDSWYPIDLATASFGQGISVTPIQLITAVNSIANKGKVMVPQVVDKIITEDGEVIEVKPKMKTRAISEKTATLVTWMMVNAVEKGEAKWTKIPEYQVAGKTGTAQIPVEGHYDPSQTNASFVGFFPPKNPRITMLVVVNKPKTSIYGSETAAPIFFSIARDLIQYYNISPNE